MYTAKDAADVEKSGAIAHVDICFGPNNEDAIRFMRIKKMSGPTAGVTAHSPKTAIIVGGQTKYMSILSGKAEQEAKLLALVAFDRVKQQFGIKFNKAYLVNTKEVLEITLP